MRLERLQAHHGHRHFCLGGTSPVTDSKETSHIILRLLLLHPQLSVLRGFVNAQQLTLHITSRFITDTYKLAAAAWGVASGGVVALGTSSPTILRASPQSVEERSHQ